MHRFLLYSLHLTEITRQNNLGWSYVVRDKPWRLPPLANLMELGMQPSCICSRLFVGIEMSALLQDDELRIYSLWVYNPPTKQRPHRGWFATRRKNKVRNFASTHAAFNCSTPFLSCTGANWLTRNPCVHYLMYLLVWSQIFSDKFYQCAWYGESFDNLNIITATAPRLICYSKKEQSKKCLPRILRYIRAFRAGLVQCHRVMTAGPGRSLFFRRICRGSWIVPHEKEAVNRAWSWVSSSSVCSFHRDHRVVSLHYGTASSVMQDPAGSAESGDLACNVGEHCFHWFCAYRTPFC